VIGAADAVYLLVLKFTQSEAMCIGNHGCVTVNNSPYSTIYNIPVSLLGLMAYLSIILILSMEPRLPVVKTYGRIISFGLALTGTLFSGYLTYLEYFVIYAVCPFCMISAVVISLILILSTIRLVRQSLP
jgi:uncharacterized membrane protein